MDIRITQRTLEDSRSLEAMEEEAYVVVSSFISSHWINFHPASTNSPEDTGDAAQLDEFVNTDFRTALGISPIVGRLGLEAALALIPQPHFVSYTDENAKPRQRLSSVKPAPVREQIHPDAQRLLQSHCSRHAWIIPVVGQPPYPYHLSAGEVVLPASNQAAMDIEHPPGQVLRWSPESLLAFWAWLKLSQAKSVFGPISLTYDRQKSRLNPNKNDFYFIKVIHKATLSMKLRVFLQVFDASPESSPDQSAQEASSKETAGSRGERGRRKRSGMILAGARLILVDEANEGIVTA